MHINLKISELEKSELSDLAAQFYQEIEGHFFPKNTTLSALKAQLKQSLDQEEDFEKTLEVAKTKAQLLVLSHKDTAIRNLPWQAATQDRDLLAIAKTHKPELEDYHPKLGYPLKVLVMVASPEGVTRLAYEEEELHLLRAFSPLMSKGQAQVHFTDDGSLENLKDKLEETKYHILHFSGHGIYKNEQGYLALEDPITGKTQMTTAEKFNKVLAEVDQMEHRPELVVLSACQTAQGQAAGDLSGVADTLMQGDIPAVIAMSASILDSFATFFAAKLYAQLSARYPLSSAFQKARLTIRGAELNWPNLIESGLSPGQWLIPQLLLNNKVLNLADENAPSEALNLENDVQIIRGEKALVELRVRPKNYVFVGRRKEKRIALRHLRKGHSILLRGQGGVGKTAMAEHLAIRLLAANPKHKVFTFSEKAPSAQALLNQMRDYLTKEKKDFKIVSELALIEKQTDQFIHLLGRVSEYGEPIFLFDNIESFQIFDESQSAWIWHQEKHEDVFQLIQILDQHTSFPLIITGRYPIAEFPDLKICNMNTVPFADFFRKCHQLGFNALAKGSLSGQIPTAKLKRQGEDKPPSFEDVCKLLHTTFGGNYRALEFFDELYAQKGENIFKILEKLSDFEEKLNEQQIKEGVLSQMSENLIFEELLSYLDEKDKDTLFVLAQFNIPVLPMAIGMQRESEDRSTSLKKAVELTLVEKQTDGTGRERYYVMPLIRDLLSNSEIHYPFDEKLAGDYHKYTYDNDLEEDWLVELTEAFERYYLAEAVDEINEVGNRINNFYFNIQQFRLSLAYGLRTEEIAREKTNSNIWNRLGLILQIFGQLDPALVYLQKSLEDDKKREDRKGEGTTLNNISQIYDGKGDYDRALSYLEQSLKIQQEIGDRRGEGTTLNNISQIYDAKGDYDRALSYLEQSLKIRQEIGDRQGEGVTLNNISQIHKVRGNYDRALSYLEQSLKIQQEIGDRKGEGTTLNNLATTAHAKGDYDRALSYLEQSLKIRQEIGDRRGEGTTLNNISQIYDGKGDYDRALSYLEQVLKIDLEIGDRQGEGTTLNNISQIHKVRGDYDRALSYLEQSLKIQQEIGDRQGEGVTLNNISQIYNAKGDYDRALSYLEQSLKIRQEIGDRKGESTTLGNIASIYKDKGDLDTALEYFYKDLDICKSIGDLHGMGITLLNLGGLFFDQNKIEEAIPYLIQSYQIFNQIGSPIKSNVEGLLGAIIEKIGEAEFQKILQNLNQ